MNILDQITQIKKEISNLETRIEADSANLKSLKVALRQFEKIETTAKSIVVPNIEKKFA